MKSIPASKRWRDLFVIGKFDIYIGLISKKVIIYPAEGCMEVSQELTFNI